MPPMPQQHRVPDQDIGEQVHPDAGGIITIENDSPSPLPSVLRAERDAEDQLREEAAFEAIWQGPEEYKPSPGTVEYLETRHLHPLKSKSAKFPRARWFCRLCEYHCDNLVKCREHYTDTRHSRLARSKEVPLARSTSFVEINIIVNNGIVTIIIITIVNITISITAQSSSQLNHHRHYEETPQSSPSPSSLGGDDPIPPAAADKASHRLLGQPSGKS